MLKDVEYFKHRSVAEFHHGSEASLVPQDDAIRHEQLDVVQLLVKYRGRPSSDEVGRGSHVMSFGGLVSGRTDCKVLKLISLYAFLI